MILSFVCRKCGTKIEADADAGPRVQCGACQALNTVPPPFIAPDVVIGGFRLIRRMGRGGMGDVYFAQQLSLKREAAVKILHRALTRDPVFLARFTREVRLTARLEHPNIVPAFEAGMDCGFHYLAMAFVDGETLEQRIRRRGPMPEVEALRRALDIARALDYAWTEHRLIHRDIKPANVITDRRGVTRLMDFGISLSLGGDRGKVTRSGLVVGTPNYMSPEAIARPNEADFRSDIYSLGATLYHAVTGQLPFAGENFAETLRRRHSAEPLPHPHDANPALSEPLVALLAEMMEPDPARRPSSWGELIADIERALAGRMPEPGVRTDARNVSAPTTSRLRTSALATHLLSRRRRLILTILLALAFALLVLDIWLLLRMSRGRRAQRTPHDLVAPD